MSKVVVWESLGLFNTTGMQPFHRTRHTLLCKQQLLMLFLYFRMITPSNQKEFHENYLEHFRMD